MDIVINSNVQSPLVRTLSATQGKSASFTHHIKDNVPPVSFSKIALTPDGGASGTYGRNYKFKIPQYGYLRSFTLKFSGAELGLGSVVVEDIYRLFANLRAPEATANAGNSVVYQGNGTTTGVGYDLRDVFGNRRGVTGSGPMTNQVWVPGAFVPPYDGNARNPNMDPWACMTGRIKGASNYSSASDIIPASGDARIFPYRMSPRFDLLPFMQKARWGLTGAAGNNSGGYYEPTLTTAMSAMAQYDPVFAIPSEGLDWHYITAFNGANFATLTPDNTTYLTGSGIGSISDDTGGVNLVSTTMADAGAPNVNLSKRYLGQRLMSTYDWCSQANLSRHLGCLMPATVTLSTHNRVIQTIYPMETLARIYRMPIDQKRRYLAMIRPHITASPSSVGQNALNFTSSANAGRISGTVTNGVSYLRPTAAAFGTYRTFDCYFPCLFSFFEDPSMNLDTRFVENLEIDCLLNAASNIYAPEDLGANVANAGVQALDVNSDNLGANLTGMRKNSRWTLTAFDGWHTSEFRQRAPVINTSNVTVTALCYYHNFHDSTSQAIRDSNFKPNVPANVLGYNTYAENPVLVTANTIVQGGSVSINLSCNNLTQEITFLVRRRQKNIASNVIQTHQAFEDYSTTLPIKNITLTGSGQQLYSGTGAECLIMDQWDYPLSSVETGSATTNDSGLYADNHVSAYAQSKPTCDGFFAYRIPFSFSSDRTYNSGSIALQTINNPVLTITFFDIHGWVLNDENLAAKLPSVFNLDENYGVNSNKQTVFDNDFQIEIYENYWQLIRIDSNTGAVTKSLDL
jgi:hypothetical protein